MSVAKLAKSQKDRKMAAFTDSCAEPIYHQQQNNSNSGMKPEEL